MQKIDVKIVGVEAFKGILELLQDDSWRQTGGVGVIADGVADLASNHQLLSMTPRLEPLPDNFLRQASVVSVRGIKKIDTLLHSQVEKVKGCVCVDRITERHGSQSKGRHF